MHLASDEDALDEGQHLCGVFSLPSPTVPLLLQAAVPRIAPDISNLRAAKTTEVLACRPPIELGKEDLENGPRRGSDGLVFKLQRCAYELHAVGAEHIIRSDRTAIRAAHTRGCILATWEAYSVGPH